MQIFNINLNGEDAKEFCRQTTEFKIEWILTYTNQQNVDLILEWIEKPKKDSDCGCGCGGHKKIQTIQPKRKMRNRK